MDVRRQRSAPLAARPLVVVPGRYGEGPGEPGAQPAELIAGAWHGRATSTCGVAWRWATGFNGKAWLIEEGGFARGPVDASTGAPRRGHPHRDIPRACTRT